MGWLKNLFGSKQAGNQGESTTETTQGKTTTFAEAWDKHRAELDKHLTPEIKQRVFLTWSQAKNREAHSYADLVASYPTKSQQIARLEAETIMQTYLYGYMAKQGWIEEIEALQMPFALGRSLRDRIRELGVSSTHASATLATDMNKALEAVLKLGMGK